MAPTPQQQRFDLGPVNLRQFEPVKAATEGAAQYTHGGHSIAGLENTQADRPRAFKIQLAYRSSQNAPETPAIRKSYESMRKETNDQYEFMTRPREKGGMGIQHEVVTHDPYKTPQEMAKDVGAGRIKTFASSATGGHAYFSDEENDRFRAVHDVFGHAATGRGFDRHGEEAAYLSHRQMFSRKAQPAMASETRYQNSYLNYGPTGDFPDQSKKLIDIPAWGRQVKRVRK